MMDTSKDPDANSAPDSNENAEAEQPESASQTGSTEGVPDEPTIEEFSEWAQGATEVRVADLEAENADVKDRLLRLAAEMENLRRRTQREISDAKQFAISSFARDVLTIGDNLHRAVEAVPEDQRTDEASGMKALVEGVEMTRREFANVLARHNVTTIDPVDEKFDPNAHEAVFQVPDPTVPTGSVSQVVQVGYRIGERVLRPAMVGVTAGGPKASTVTEAASKDTPETHADEPPIAEENAAETLSKTGTERKGPGSTVNKTA